MYLTIDAGNTRTKAVVYDAAGLAWDSITAEGNELAPIKEIVRRNSIEHVIVSTTGIREWKLSDLGIKGKNIELNHEVPLPIRIVYSTPETLGQDRIAAACGAQANYPGKNCLVISAGTCMTMDMLLGSGVYLGGNIAPGLRMRLQAMHEYTAKLPLVEPGHRGHRHDRGQRLHRACHAKWCRSGDGHGNRRNFSARQKCFWRGFDRYDRRRCSLLG